MALQKSKWIDNLSEAYLTLLTRTIFETKEFEMGEIHAFVTDYILKHTIESEALSWVLYRGYLKYVKNQDLDNSLIFSDFISTQKSHLELSAPKNRDRSFEPNRSEKLNKIIEKDDVDYWADFQVWYGKVVLN